MELCKEVQDHDTLSQPAQYSGGPAHLQPSRRTITASRTPPHSAGQQSARRLAGSRDYSLVSWWSSILFLTRPRPAPLSLAGWRAERRSTDFEFPLSFFPGLLGLDAPFFRVRRGFDSCVEGVISCGSIVPLLRRAKLPTILPAQSILFVLSCSHWAPRRWRSGLPFPGKHPDLLTFSPL